MSETAVIVLSCAWEPHTLTRHAWETLHARYWPDCPWEVHWIEDTVRGRNWGDFVAEALATRSEDVVLITMNDMVSSAPADDEEIQRCRSEMDAFGADYFRIVPVPGCTEPFAHGRSGWHAPNVPYAKSLYPAFWRREYLIDQAVRVGDPWSFELGTIREPVGKHCSVSRGNRPYSIMELLKRGRWIPDGLRLLQREGIPLPEGVPVPEGV